MSIKLFADLVAHGVRPVEAAISTDQRAAAEELMIRDDVKRAIAKAKAEMRAQLADYLLSSLEAAQMRRDGKTVAKCVANLGKLNGMKETDTTEPVKVTFDYSKEAIRQDKRRKM